MLALRTALLAAWLVLILSLFWDPLTPKLTAAGATLSPFHIHGTAPTIQGHPPAPQNAYAMGARIWWTMIVPLIPMFLMLFGHEAWRRICPLAFASQFPRYFGLVRKSSSVQRHSGKVVTKVSVIGRGNWLDRNALYLQMGLLYLGLTARLLFANADRHALAILLLVIIGAAMVVGTLWGGRTWCHYVCPINIVQKIYTEPRGLLESSPHLGNTPLGQSACRVPSPVGDQIACVGCTSSCSDIDLEGAYWETAQRPARRHVYYIFYGLIWGFYCYYFLYAGNWDYYFSGYWTHEQGQLSNLLAPGFFIGHRALPIPKLVAAPLTLALFAAVSLACGTLLEALYRRVRHRTRRIPEAEIVNHCLSFTSFLSINTFYLFGGRPNVLLLPEPFIRMFDVAIPLLSALWLFTAIHRTPFKYRQEGLAASLLAQLKKLKVDVSRYMDGRDIDDLEPDEVYVLSKVLPAYTREQKVLAYKRILDEMISQQKTTTVAGLQVLQDLRAEMAITPEEHTRLLDELGHDHALELDPSVVSARERAQSMANYATLIGRAVCKRIEVGDTFDAAYARADIQDLVRMLRPSFQIDDQEHENALALVRAPSGDLETRVGELQEQLTALASAKLALLSPEVIERLSSPLIPVLRAIINARTLSQLRAMLSLLRAIGHTDLTLAAVRACARLFADTFVDAMMEQASAQTGMTWKESLDASLVQAVVDTLCDDETASHRDAVLAATLRITPATHEKLTECLRSLATDSEPLHCAIAAFALAKLDLNEAADWHVEVLANRRDLAQHWLVAEVMDVVSRGMHAGPEQTVARDPIEIIVQGPSSAVLQAAYDSPSQPRRDEMRCSFAGLSIRIGSDSDNDLHLPEIGVAPQHFLARVQGGRLVGGPLGGESAWLNGRPIEEESVIRSGDVLTLTPGLPPICTLTFIVPAYDLPYIPVRLHTVVKLSMLFAGDGQGRRGAMSLEAAASIARHATVRRYPRDFAVTDDILGPGENCMLTSGLLRNTAAPADDERASETIGSTPARVTFSGADNAPKSYCVVSLYADLMVWQESKVSSETPAV